MDIGQIIKVWDNKVNNMEDAELIEIRRNVVCCEHTESEHIHSVLYDVKFLHDGRISKGHLPD
jgi:hypothetical protein